MRRKPPLINKTTATSGLVSDINDLGDVSITSAANGDLLQFDGSNWVDVAQVSDGNVPASAVTQHEASLTITESQISDLSHTTDHGALTGLADNDHPQYARLATNETVTGAWTFSDSVILSNYYRVTDAEGPANSADGFFRIATNTSSAGRDACDIYVSATGGNHVPNSMHLSVSPSWGADAPAVTIVSSEASGSISQIRPGRDATTGEKYIDISLAGSTSDSIIRVLVLAHKYSGNGWIAEVTTSPAPATPSSTYTIDSSASYFGSFNTGGHNLNIRTDGVFISDGLDVGGALTAASYGGIAEANLVDKSGPETIAGEWEFHPPSNFLTIKGGTNDNNFSGVRVQANWGNTGTNKPIALFGAVAFDNDISAGAATNAGSIGFLATNAWTSTSNANTYITFRPLVAGAETELMRLSSDGTLDASTVDADFDALTATSYGGIAEANLLDKTANETISGAWTFTDNPYITNSSSAILAFREEDAGSDEKEWQLRADGDLFRLALRTDAGSFGSTAIEVARTGTTTTEIELNATTLDFNGAADFSSTLRAADGSVGVPSYSFSDDTDTGMYRTAPDVLAFTTGGVLRAQLYNSFLRLQSGTTLGIQESASANADIAGYGQVWVHNDTPNTLWFTDDAGNDHHVAGGQLTENFGAAKPDAEDVTSSTTFQEDDDLVIDIQSGFTYQFTAVLEVASFSNTPNFKFRFSFPVGSSGSYHVVAYDPVDSSVASPVYARASNALAFSHTVPLDSTNPGVIAGLAVVVVTGFVTAGANGEFALEWAQATSSGTATTLRTGSTLQLNRG